MERLYQLIESPIKAFIATLSGTILGYTPNISSAVTGIDTTSLDRGFQHAVWMLTIIVAIFAIISAVQKQIDRYKANHKNRIKSIFDDIDDDEPIID